MRKDMSTRTRVFRSAAIFAILPTLVLGGAATANAATPLLVQSTPTSAIELTTIQVSPNAAILETPHPNYAAGSYYYVCVFTSGTTQTLTYGQKTTACKGAAYIQQWLESGQFVQSLPLTPTGVKATAKFNATTDCYVALGSAALAVLTAEDSWAWYAGAAGSTYGLHACISE